MWGWLFCFSLNEDWYLMLPDGNQRRVNNKGTSWMGTHHALLHCSRQWPISICHSEKKKAQWYILAPQHLPEWQAAGLEQSQGRNAISLKNKITTHLPFWKPREKRQLYRIKQQVCSDIFQRAAAEKHTDYREKSLLICTPKALAITWIAL